MSVIQEAGTVYFELSQRNVAQECAHLYEIFNFGYLHFTHIEKMHVIEKKNRLTKNAFNDLTLHREKFTLFNMFNTSSMHEANHGGK